MSLHRAASPHEVLPLSVPDAIRRPAIRGFDPARAVPDDLLRQALALASLAPSSFNLQPWRFLVVRDERNRQRLRGCAFNYPRLTEAPIVVVVLGYHHPHRSHLDAIVASQQSLGAITPEEAAELRGRALGSMERRLDPSLWSTRWAMLATGTLLLAAESLGLCSVPIDDFDPEAVKQAFGVPDDHTACCLVALGYAAQERRFLGRLGLSELCYEEHFGQPWTLGDDPPPDAMG